MRPTGLILTISVPPPLECFCSFMFPLNALLSFIIGFIDSIYFFFFFKKKWELTHTSFNIESYLKRKKIKIIFASVTFELAKLIK